MSYQALLFCPDEKTARVVSQVLTELEFAVEPCHEPFAAVKKLMVQHFDAIVVDCDNEQNAALLFKSARNSGSNQASLAVAVVEGQTGVAKAFRLGANLVLTKPIHVEQSKGTLRVARGLLRKGQSAKAAAGVASSAATTAVAQPFAPSTFPPPQKSSATPPSVSASAFDLDAEPAPQPDVVDAALLEYMPDSPLSSGENAAQVATESDPSKQYPWQPRKPLAEPMASALRRAAEAAGKSEFDAAGPHSAGASGNDVPQSGTPRIATPQIGLGQPGLGQPLATSHSKTGAAAAPARAREIPASSRKELGLEPTASAVPAPATEEIKRIEDPSAGEGWESKSPSAAAEAPTFNSLDGSQEASDAGGSKKTLLIAGLVIGLAAAGYFGWTKMQSAHPEPAVQQSAAPSSPTSFASQPVPSVPEAQSVTGTGATQQPEQASNGATAVPVPSKPSAAVITETPGLKASVPANATPAATEVTAVKTQAPAKALMVQSEAAPRDKSEPEAPESEAPPAGSIANGASSTAISGIVNTTAINARKAPQQAVRISQGVSVGLIVKKVQPIYPARAQQMHLEGKVELLAEISPLGSITGVKQVSGDLILGRAAMDAVRQWKYKPYYLNGEPIQIQTQITVDFKLP